MSEHIAEIDALIAERERVMDMEPAGTMAAERQGEVIADLSRRINQLARDASPAETLVCICDCDGDDGETGHDLLCPRLNQCHNGHPFVPGVSTDHAPGESDPRWCDTCGETRALPPGKEGAA